MRNKNFKIATILLLLILFLAPVISLSAETIFNDPKIFIQPNPDDFSNPDTLTLDIKADPAGTPINLAYINLKYPVDKLTLKSVNYSDSFCELQIFEEINEESGELFLACGTTSREMNASSTIARLTFEKLSSGMAELYFNDAGLLASDGYGTNILSSAENNWMEVLK